MKIVSPARQSSDPTAAHPAAWAAGRGEETHSATFRALAWSQEDDGAADPLPYIGDLYGDVAGQNPAPEADSQPTGLVGADGAETPSTRSGRPAVLFGIAAGFAAVACGGLLLAVLNTDDGPTRISPEVTQPARNVTSQPNTATAAIRPPSPAPVRTAAGPALVVPSAVAPSRAFPAPAPESQTPAAPEAAVPAAVAPAATVPAAVPEVSAPEVSAPEFTAPDATPPVWVPPVTPQPVPHPVGPQTFHVPAVSGPIHVPTVGDPALPLPAAPDPVLTLTPDLVLPVTIPTLSTGAGR